MIPINAPCRSRTSVAVDIALSIWLNNFNRRLVVVSAKSSAILDMRRSYRRNRADVKIADCYQRSKSQTLAINLLSIQSTVTHVGETVAVGSFARSACYASAIRIEGFLV